MTPNAPPDPERNAPSNRWSPAILMMWSMTVVAVAAIPIAYRRALWMDELFTVDTVGHGTLEMLRLLFEYHRGTYDHPPLYFLLLRCVRVFTDSPLALRLPSLLFIGAGVGLWSIEIRRHGFSIATAACFAVLLGLHSVLHFQATNIRMYGLYFLLAGSVILLLGRLPKAEEREPRLRLTLAIGALMSAVVYTNYFGILFGFCVGLLGLIWLVQGAWGRAERWRAGLCVIAACFAGAVFTLPWVPAVLHMVQTEDSVPLILNRRGSDIVKFLDQLCSGLGGFAFVVIGWAMLAVGHPRRVDWLTLLAAFVAFPFAVVVLFTPRDRYIDVRYLIFSIPVALTGAAMGWHFVLSRILRSTRWSAAALALVLLTPAAFSFVGSRNNFSPSAPDWWGVAEILESNVRPGEIILTGGYMSGPGVEYHLDDPARFRFIHRAFSIEDFRSHSRDPEVVWFINTQPMTGEFAAIETRSFPYLLLVESNSPITPTIRVRAKRPFTIPWDAEAVVRRAP